MKTFRYNIWKLQNILSTSIWKQKHNASSEKLNLDKMRMETFENLKTYYWD